MRVLAALMLVTALLSGCATDQPLAPDALPDPVVDLLAGAPLWYDPQNAPHPSFNFPTMSSPAANATGYWAPIPAAPLPAPLAGMTHLAQTANVTSGAGIALFGSLAVVPGFGAETSVVDISDPANPVVLSKFAPQQGTHRGAAIIAYPDGRIVTVISTSSIIDVWDITDPTYPVPLPPLNPSQGSHKLGVVPGTPIIYNAASGGGGTGSHSGTGTRFTEIFDLSDPTNGTLVQEFKNGYSCHHVYFWNNLEENKFRAICAGIEFTQIWDTTDPMDPNVIVSVPVHHGVAGTPSGSIPIVAFSHYAGLSQNGKVLLVGDEMGGGGIPPGCVGEARTALGSLSTPVGALWFYDVSDEKNPVLLGWYSPLNDPRIKNMQVSCTAHHGRMVPAEGRDVVAMSFYGAGVVLLDFTQPKTPIVIDQFVSDSDTWETWYYNGYLFTGDLARGMDVISLR